jgi:hypothetical protein
MKAIFSSETLVDLQRTTCENLNSYLGVNIIRYKEVLVLVRRKESGVDIQSDEQ